MRKKLGECLIQAGLITEDDLRSALTEHKRTGERLGAVLVLSSVAPGQAADPASAGVSVDVPAASAESRKDDEPVMLMGGVTDPSAAADAMEADDDVPELPVVHEPADG